MPFPVSPEGFQPVEDGRRDLDWFSNLRSTPFLLQFLPQRYYAAFARGGEGGGVPPRFGRRQRGEEPGRRRGPPVGAANGELQPVSAHEHGSPGRFSRYRKQPAFSQLACEDDLSEERHFQTSFALSKWPSSRIKRAAGCGRQLHISGGACTR